MTKTIFNYTILAKFGEELYENILQPKDAVEEISIDGVYFWLLKQGKTKYLLPRENAKGEKSIDTLPLKVISSEPVDYAGKVYYQINSASPVRVQPEQSMSFRELVDGLCDYSHTQPKQYLLFKLTAITSFLNRINVRVTSPPGFGKDSLVKVLGYLMGNVKVIHNPTIAKLEYYLTNKLLMLNEVAGLNKQTFQDMQQFLLSCGEFSNVYVKRSRASSGTSEEYDISKLSLLVAYNNYDCYMDKTEYFDNKFSTAVRDRFLPLTFSGVLPHDQFVIEGNASHVAKQNMETFKKIIRTLKYYSNENNLTMKEYNIPDKVTRGIDPRHMMTLTTISKYVKEYARDEEEFQDLMMEVRKCYDAYKQMLMPQAQEDNKPFEEFLEDTK